MSEVPEGVNLNARERGGSSPDGHDDPDPRRTSGVEVLLGLRSPTMRAFPSYWAFPGGGVSRVDHAAVEALPELAGPEAAAIACIMREMSEELGVVPTVKVSWPCSRTTGTPSLTTRLDGFLLALAEAFPVNRTNIRTLSHRITPPFGPVQFDNAFLHLHVGAG